MILKKCIREFKKDLEIRFNTETSIYQFMLNGTIELESYDFSVIEKCIKDEIPDY